jgi:hypothetical protein
MPAKAAVKPVATSGKLAVASTGISRIDTSSSIGGYSNFDTSNRFQYYDDLCDANVHVSTSVWKTGMSLTKGMTINGDKKRDVREFEQWSERVNLVEQAQTIAFRLIKYGTEVSRYVGGVDNFSIEPLLMAQTSLLPEGVLPKSRPKNTITGQVEKIYINENDASNRISYNVDEILYGSWNRYHKVQQDVLKRDTYGLYGASLLEPLISPIRHLLAVTHSYIQFVEKYGNGRYVINFEILNELAKAGIISPDAIGPAIAEFSENHKYLKANEDIIGAGIEVTPIDANGTLDVLSFKKSLESDIQIGLFQTPLSMGDTKGSTYAAGYVSEEDRMTVLEGLQYVNRNIVQKIINKRLDLMNKSPDTVWVEFDELSKAKLESGDITELYSLGIIDENEVRTRAGFPVKGGGAE